MEFPKADIRGFAKIVALHVSTSILDYVTSSKCAQHKSTELKKKHVNDIFVSPRDVSSSSRLSVAVVSSFLVFNSFFLQFFNIPNAAGLVLA